MLCSFCEEERDDLTTGGDVSICGDCRAEAEVIEECA